MPKSYNLVMKRFAESALNEWKNRSKRKPLLLRGVRQSGKTYLLNEIFSKQFPNCHYFDLEKNKKISSLFEERDIEPHRIISDLEFVVENRIKPQTDLIIFDEIQACPRALTSLKYFCQDMPEAFICAAGSLLGMSLSHEPFPVGKVEFLDVHPMSFQEFLSGTGEDKALEVIMNLSIDSKLPEVVHSHLWQLFGEYISVGGMPEVVAEYGLLRDESLYRAFEQARMVQNTLLDGYMADIAKHSGKTNSMHIERVWRSIPAQLGRELNGNAGRFRFRGIIPGKKGFRSLTGPIDWLEKARMVLKVPVVERGEPPLTAWEKPGIFKLYIHDIGILSALARIPLLDRGGFIQGFYKGWMAENLVAQELVASGVQSLFGWKGKTSEVEFVIQQSDNAIPVEVKAGKRTQAKSAGVFADRYSSSSVVKLGYWNFSQKGRSHLLPLYAAGLLADKDCFK